IGLQSLYDGLSFRFDADGKALFKWTDILYRFHIVCTVKGPQKVEIKLNLLMPLDILVDHAGLVLIEHIPQPESSIATEVYAATPNTAHRHTDVVQLLLGFEI